MRLIGIDSQMIAKAKIWILLYKDFVVSHSASLEDKQRNKVEDVDIPWFHSIFNVFSLSLVCVQKPFCIDFYVSFSLFAGNLSKDECGKFCARNAEETTYGACDGPSIF